MAQQLRKDPGSVPNTHMGGSQLFLGPIPEGLVPSSGLCRHQAHAQCAYADKKPTPPKTNKNPQNPLIYIKYLLLFLRQSLPLQPKLA